MNGFDQPPWHNFGRFRFSPPAGDVPTQPMCQPMCWYAQQYWGVTQKICLEPLRSPNYKTINRAKVLLTDGYFQWRWLMLKDHHDTSENGHICLIDIFERGYEKLALALASMTDWPVVYDPSPPPQKKPFRGVTWGEVMTIKSEEDS